MKGYTRVKRLSAWRRIAQAFWDEPKDGTIYGHVVLDCTAAFDYLDKLERETGVRASLGVLAGKAMAVAYDETPGFNGKIIWGTIYQKDSVDVYYQVDIDDGGDLAGVVVRSVEKKSPDIIAQELRAKARKLRKGDDKQYEKTQKGLLGRMSPWLIRKFMNFLLFLQYNLGLDLSAFGAEPDPFGTIMVSNVGRFQIDVAYAPLPTPSRVPSVVLLAGVHDKPIAVDGKVEVRPCVAMCGTFDHRFADGNQLGKIQNRVRHYMLNPELYEKILAEGGELPNCNLYRSSMQEQRKTQQQASDASKEGASKEEPSADAQPDTTAESEAPEAKTDQPAEAS